MKIFQFAYNLASFCLAPAVLPVLWYHERRDPERRTAMLQRLGYDDPNPLASNRPAGPVIWIHAVSVGEVKAAEAVIHALNDASSDLSFVLTTTTMTGQRHARNRFGSALRIRYAPLDLWWTTDRFLTLHRPDVLVCMETEIWPNWITLAHRKGIKILFLNGRISSRSIRSYKRIRPLIAPILQKVDAFSMISESDARRIVHLGAPANRVRINGNAKMDAPGVDDDTATLKKLKALYAIDDKTPVFVAGSIRGVEVEILMDVYDRLACRIPELVFIVAPRHIQNAPRIAACARSRAVRWQYRTDLEKNQAKRAAPVVILDTIGELRHVYRFASVVFCGGSLVPLGGQNVLEPAMCGKPVLFGPFMEDFQDASALLEASGGGVCVQNGQALAERAGDLLAHADNARRMGRRAKQAVLANRGAARRHAKVVADMLNLPYRLDLSPG
ncbi:3-deoxy-D-manno-octulosonic acid transferase [Desulfosarcina widdelii]|uniref:3-deoxy-D-manno-octulosonic acid transferase n=1 Tax=Desulfosarcina widdelii TaxID=947919 RepID=A0A5K7Z3I9_9BACT|nr:3-deoxy-D-manno-octulosonic acid transferase [Desulfosarcina widdelii]BBO74121.1 3-deoxy-D-manno-octulosonic acid transferase [Desulfosarcina widdelii]